MFGGSENIIPCPLNKLDAYLRTHDDKARRVQAHETALALGGGGSSKYDSCLRPANSGVLPVLASRLYRQSINNMCGMEEKEKKRERKERHGR